MTPFILLSLAMGTLAGAWLTHPLWRPHLHGTAHVNSVFSTAPQRISLTLPIGLAVFVLLLAAAGYAWVGSADDIAVGPAGSGATTARVASSAARDPRGAALTEAETRMTAMVDRLAERLKADPADADGWHMLGRSYAALGRHAQAIDAFRAAARLRPDDAALLAEWAFSAAVINPRSGEDEPVQLVERALRIDPKDPKALALAGTLALDRRDFQAAIDYWEQLARVEPPDSAIGRQIQASIAQVRQRAASQPSVLPLALRADGAASASGAGQLSGTVTLAAALRDKVAPDDTVFIYARSSAGPRMPLAVLKKQVKDLPLSFTLDDSLALAPTAKLSSATSVVVGARIARSGNAVAQEGDLQGQIAPVALGSRELAIEINEVVRNPR